MKTFLFSDHIYNQQMVLDKECFKKDQEGCLAFKWAMIHFFYLIFFLQLRYFVFISRTISRLLQILK